MKREEIEKKVIQLFENELEIEGISVTDKIEDLNVDSLDRDVVEYRCEDIFDFTESFSVWGDFWKQCVTIKDLCDFIEERI